MYIYVPPQIRFYAYVKTRPPTWLFLHISEVSSLSVRWSLLGLSCSLRKQFIYASRGFLSKWRETPLWMFPDATQAGTSSTFADGFRDDNDRGEKWFCLVEGEGDRNDGGVWLGEETSDGVAWWKKMTTLHCSQKCCERRPRCSNYVVTLVFVEGLSVRLYENRPKWNIASQSSGELQSGSAASKSW